MNIRFASALLFVAGTITTHADSPVLVLDEVVVTAERIAHPIRDIAASVSLVTAEEINRANARTATDVLSGLPGVFIQRTGQFGRTDLDIRGIGDRGCKNLVLVDGRPEKMSLFGCTVSHTLPLNNIERIEVVRGPLSVLYGSDAMSGVVNIVTRRARERLEAGARLDYGSFNTVHGRISGGTRQAGFHALVSADKAMSDGHLDNSEYNGNDVSLRAGYDFNPAFELDFTGKYFTGVKHEPKKSTDPDTVIATGWNQYDRGGLDLTATAKTAVADGFLKLYRTFGEHKFDPQDGWHSQDHTDGVLLHAHRRFVFGNLSQVGLEFKSLAATWIKSDTDRPGWNRREAAVFFQTEQTMGLVTANAGTRFNWDEVSGIDLSPKAGLVVKLPWNTTLRASINKGFRTPSMNYTFVFPPGNDSLKPEVSWNYEVGANQEIMPGLNLDVAGFVFQGENLIETARVEGRMPPYQFQNKGSFSFKGIEAGVIARLKPLRASISYSYLDPGIHTRARPGSKLDLSAGTTLRGLDADLSFQHVGRYYAEDSSRSEIPSYSTLNARVGYHIMSWLGLFASMDNVLDAEYDTFADLPGSAAGLYRMPGRSFTVGIDLKQP